MSGLITKTGKKVRKIFGQFTYFKNTFTWLFFGSNWRRKSINNCIWFISTKYKPRTLGLQTFQSESQKAHSVVHVLRIYRITWIFLVKASLKCQVQWTRTYDFVYALDDVAIEPTTIRKWDTLNLQIFSLGLFPWIYVSRTKKIGRIEE